MDQDKYETLSQRLVLDVRNDISEILEKYFIGSSLYITLGISEDDVWKIGESIYSYVWGEPFCLLY